MISLPAIPVRLLVLSLLLWPMLVPVQADERSFPPIDDGAIDRKMHTILARLHDADPDRTIDHFLDSIGGAFDFDLKAPSTDLLDAVTVQKRLRRSVFVVAIRYKCDNCTRWHLRNASAFAVGPSHVVTNHHVIKSGGANGIILGADGDYRPILGILAVDTEDDLALLRVEGAGLVPLPLASANPPVGEDIFLLSNPANHYFVFTRGMVSRLSRRRHGDSLQLEVTAPYARGSSGSSVVDARGNVVGVVKATRSIYYEEKGEGDSESLQMVLRITVPVSELHSLLAKGASDPEEAPEEGGDGE